MRVDAGRPLLPHLCLLVLIPTPPCARWLSLLWSSAVGGWAALVLWAASLPFLLVASLLLAVAVVAAFSRHAAAASRRELAVSSAMLVLPVFAFIAMVAGVEHAVVRTVAWAAVVGALFGALRAGVHALRTARRRRARAAAATV